MMDLYILTLYLIHKCSMKVSHYYFDAFELGMFFSCLAIIRKNLISTILIIVKSKSFDHSEIIFYMIDSDELAVKVITFKSGSLSLSGGTTHLTILL